jgi:hypothetical protein
MGKCYALHRVLNTVAVCTVMHYEQLTSYLYSILIPQDLSQAHGSGAQIFL